MGKKYLKRYNNHFKNAIIHPQEYRYEELLVSYPEKWRQCIKQICLKPQRRSLRESQIFYFGKYSENLRWYF